MTFINGTGNNDDIGPPKYLYRGNPNPFAAALAVAILTARIELAPRFDLLSVSSSCFITESTVA